MAQTSGCEIITTKQETIANLARQAPGMVLTTLAHHIDLMWLEEAYRRTRKDGAVGVDGVTAEVYEARLQENLSDLLERFKSGRYQAPPVRRVHIPKDGTKKTRPIGIPTFIVNPTDAQPAFGMGHHHPSIPPAQRATR